MFKYIVGTVCIFDGLVLLGMLGYYLTQPGIYVHNPVFLAVLYLIPVLVGIGVIKNSLFSKFIAVLFFSFQLWAFYSLNFSMPIKLSWEMVGAGTGLRIDLSAIVLIILSIVLIFDSNGNRLKPEDRVEPIL